MRSKIILGKTIADSGHPGTAADSDHYETVADVGYLWTAGTEYSVAITNTKYSRTVVDAGYLGTVADVECAVAAVATGYSKTATDTVLLVHYRHGVSYSLLDCDGRGIPGRVPSPP